MRALAVIPAFNSADYLPRLLPAIKAQLPDVLVVDDGSTDSTFGTAQSCGAMVIKHETNRGKGAALKTGFDYALKHGFEAVVTLDSDLQHDPGYIPIFMGAFEATGADLIIGSRNADVAGMPLDRRFSNWTTSHLLTILLRRKIEDSQCGFRLYSRKILETVKLESDRFELETEVIIKGVQAGLRIEFIPIKARYGLSFPSHISRLADTFRWCRRVLELI